MLVPLRSHLCRTASLYCACGYEDDPATLDAVVLDAADVRQRRGPVEAAAEAVGEVESISARTGAGAGAGAAAAAAAAAARRER